METISAKENNNVAKMNQENGVESTSQFYESKKAIGEYLLLHYGSPSVVMPWNFSISDALDLPRRSARFCIQHCSPKKNHKMTALDMGCSVGGSTFELATFFDEVIGFDYSQRFIDIANHLKRDGSLQYQALEEGQYYSEHVARVPKAVDMGKVTFEQGDACSIRSDIGCFDCVLASNLIDRLSEPCKFLHHLKSLVKSGGIVIIISPHTYMEKYTEKEKWLGGYTNDDDKVVKTDERLKVELRDHFDFVEVKEMPFLIRETAREFLWTVSQAMVWRRK